MEQVQTTEQRYYLQEAYTDFLRQEGVPVLDGAHSVDCLSVPLEPWPRLGGRGAYVHLAGRNAFTSSYIVEVPPRGQLKPERHLHDKLMHVLAGRGATSVELPSGKRLSFEWGPGSLFGIPLNAPHQLFNGSGAEPARLVAMTSLPLYLNLFRDLSFVFENPHPFRERFGEERYFQGEGEFRQIKPGRHQWETNFVADLSAFALPEWTRWDNRGAGGRSINFVLADSTMHAHISEFPSGTYKKAHRRPAEAGVYLVCVSGHGYSLLWQEDEDPVDTIRVDWKPGVMFGNGFAQHYHQHFNTAAQPSRYLAWGFGGHRHLVEGYRKAVYDGADKSVREGGRQIEYEDEEPRVHQLFERELAKRGLTCRMEAFFRTVARV